MEDQVAQAALAMVSPTTDGPIRRQASQFLEEWTQSPEAWEIYVKWLRSGGTTSINNSGNNNGNDNTNGNSNGNASNNNPNQIAMQLLCLTMLQTKLRKEIPRNNPQEWHPHVNLLRQELWDYIRRPMEHVLILPCCICNAAIIVRCGILADFVSLLQRNSGELPPDIALKLLACIPAEMEACQDLTTPQVTENLVPHLEPVLDTIRRGLENPSTMLQACQALKAWADTAHVSLSQLNTPTCGGPHAVLPIMINILSSSSCSDQLLLQLASQALMAAVMVVSDHCEQTRSVAAATLWNAIPHGFVINPLQLATQNEWHDACHALANLICVFVTEQIDDLVSQPADVGLQLLLDLQSHPHTPVAIIPLDCWLTIQEISLEERHENWKRPLFRKVVERILHRLAYPTNFTNWQDELDVDSSEFEELRRMVGDILVSSYYLLRVELIQLFTNQIRSANHWTGSEAALYCLTQISKDVCSRCNSKTAAEDRDATCRELVQLLDQLVTMSTNNLNNNSNGNNPISSQHPLLLAGIINFCGSYAPAWKAMECPPQAILQLLAFLHSTFAVLPIESAKATRAIYVAYLSKNLSIFTSGDNNGASSIPQLLKSMRQSMESALATTEEEAMTLVAEGATRLVTKLQDPVVARQAFSDLLHPVLHRGQSTVQAFPESTNQQDWMDPNAQMAVEALVRCLSVVHTIVRFCDAPPLAVMGEWLLQEVGPFLEMVQQRVASSPAQTVVLPKWIAIHQQLLRNTLPQQNIMMTIFMNTIPLVVQALEQTRDPSTLKYMSAAVEIFGGKSDEIDKSFMDLLSHVTTVITSQSNLSESTDLLQGYFECLHRYTLYCPRALCSNPQFATILTLAVESISALQGAKESTRASLLFLSQLFGWNLLRLTTQAQQVLHDAWHAVLAETLVRHGLTLTQACVLGLAGGPQMLWPAYSECLFSITQVILAGGQEQQQQNNNNSLVTVHLNESMIQNWLYTSMNLAVANATASGSSPSSVMSNETCNQVITIFLNLSRQGQKSRPKAKMLLSDFAKIIKGEMAPDALVSYALN